MRGELLQFISSDRRLRPAKGDKSPHIRLEKRALTKIAERLVNVGVNASWRHISGEIGCCAIQCVKK
ncbi:hypothetical protein [Pararhodobacter zhoushanensis]|uniref:Transposase n=1 Tax=Pararhodobacter zhoushanensis TaxID=2479545 RepID=A0ABT3H1U5_9RHOB|nr:hypothetical protein [Pararhodobacter zhoushanensis]MCW1933700.1 hypothetical protein [Pararhodobacter zhoushanensis]